MRWKTLVGTVLVGVWAASPLVAQGTAAQFESDVVTQQPVVQVLVTHDSDLVNAIAVEGASIPAPGYGTGGQFWGGNIGVQAYSSTMGLFSRVGILAKGSNGSFLNYGVKAEADAADWENGQAVGVYSTASCSGTGCDALAIYADGDISYSGSLIGPASDRKLKRDIEPLASSLERLLQLEVVTFRHTLDPEFASMRLADGPQVGFVAQQVAEVLPDLVVETFHPGAVTDDASGESFERIRYQAIETMKLIPLLVRAMQEQQQQIEALKAELATRRNLLAEMHVDGHGVAAGGQ